MIEPLTLRRAAQATLLGFALLATAATAVGQVSAPAAKPCEADAAYHRLDFWHGHWEVFAEGKKDGTDYVEKILGGCALIEHWHDADGSEGKSLFYYNLKSKKWKQVWVTDGGPMKEKEEVDPPAPGAVRFQGEGYRKNGSTIPDRTTLTPLPGDKIRQVIEMSKDGGKTWDKVYDATYQRPGAAPK